MTTLRHTYRGILPLHAPKALPSDAWLPWDSSDTAALGLFPAAPPSTQELRETIKAAARVVRSSAVACGVSATDLDATAHPGGESPALAPDRAERQFSGQPCETASTVPAAASGSLSRKHKH